jgi:hypothetical protein
MSLTALLVVAVAVDTATFLLLPPGAERNPLVLALGPVAAIALRWLGVLLFVAVPGHLSLRARNGLLLGAVCGSCIGIGSNLAALT